MHKFRKRFVGGVGLCVLGMSTIVTVQLHAQEGKPSLSQFVEEVLNSHNEIQAANATIRGIEFRIEAVRRSFDNPDFDFEFENIGSIGGSDGDAVRNYRFGLSKSIDMFGRIDALKQVSEARRAQAIADLDNTKLKLASATLSAIVVYETSIERVDLLESHVHIMEESNRVAASRMAAGDISRIDLEIANLALAETRVASSQAALEQVNAIAAMRLLSSTEDTEMWPSFDLEPPSIEEIERLILDELPTVRVANLNTRIADAEVTLAEKERQPNPTVGIGLGEDDNEKMFAISFEFPLPFPNRYKNSIASARQESQSMKHEEDQIRRSSQVRAFSAFERYRIVYRTWQQWQAGPQRKLDELTSLLDRTWQAGDLNPADYLSFSERIVNARLQGLALEYVVWDAWISWLTASNRLFDWLERIN